MKTIWTLFMALFIIANFATAQDTLYVYKAGAVIYKQAVTEVDSLTFFKNYTTVTDIDGNVYKTVTIGTQTWMAENLRVSHYRNGSGITNVTGTSAWFGLTSEAYCSYNNDPANDVKYGKFYNYYAVSDSRNIAPTGWHVASSTEWSTLVSYLGGASIAGGKLKQIGTTFWAAPNTSATNEENFSAIPAGLRSWIDGLFIDQTHYSYWWCSNETGTYGFFSQTYYNNKSFLNSYSNKPNGMSVRCVKD
jgi:uncharacterized protein (TIGR02145 family)